MERETREELKNYMIDELRYGPETVKATLRKMDYIMTRINPGKDEREAFQEYIREIWDKKGNKTANGYVKIINRYLSFKKIAPRKSPFIVPSIAFLASSMASAWVGCR